MAIRMEKDDPGSGKQKPSTPSPGQNSGGMLKNLLPLILMFVIQRPKLILPLLLIGGAWYFFLGGQELLSGGYDAEEGTPFSFGAELNEERYDQAEVFEPLSASVLGSGGLPPSVSLERFTPQAKHQGQQGSCVGWATSYAGRTIMEAANSGLQPDQVAFSPSFLYNQIALPGCEGAYMRDAMEHMYKVGGLPFSQFPYDERSCRSTPSPQQKQSAAPFRIKGYNRLTKGGNNYSPDLNGIRQHLAQGVPVIIGMQVGGTFMHQMRGKKVWVPTQRDYGLYGFSGHAMCVIGYDDQLEGGAFLIMNSWGRDWGQNGSAWVRYRDFEQFVKEAYGMYPMGNSEQLNPNKLDIQFGLLDNATQKLLPLQETSNRVFRTRSPIRKGDKFKVAVTNSIECYIYVFGEEADGSSSVLFPYTEKHSPYCGITGTRVFPKDYSMTADEVGNRDRIAVVVSKSELNYQQLNQLLNQSRQSSYAGKFQEVLGPASIQKVQFNASESVRFSAEIKDREQAVGVVIEIDKR
jgi:hypothetical protein